MKTPVLIHLSILFYLIVPTVNHLYAQTSEYQNIWIVNSVLLNSSDQDKYLSSTNELKQILSTNFQTNTITTISNYDEWNKSLPKLLADKKDGKCPLIIFYGHANSTPNDVNFHLKGKDLPIRKIGIDLQKEKGAIGIIWSAEAGRSIVPLLKGTNHIIVAASELEDKDNEPVMSDLIINVFKSCTTHSKQITLADVHKYAKQDIKNWYSERQLIQLETIILEGNSDGTGTIAPDETDLKGARRIILKRK